MTGGTRWWTAWLTGVLMMLAVALLWEATRAGPVSITASGSSRAPSDVGLPTLPTLSFVIVFPTETPAPSPTVRPTHPPTATVADAWCPANPTPGTACRMPLPTKAPPTPYPSCDQVEPGDWCLWPTWTPTLAPTAAKGRAE